jgi:hypothetical protein
MQARTTTIAAQQEQLIQVVAEVVQTLTLHRLLLVALVLLSYATLAHSVDQAVL